MAIAAGRTASERRYAKIRYIDEGGFSMRLASIKRDGAELAAIRAQHGWVALADANAVLKTAWPEELGEIVLSGRLGELAAWFREEGEALLLLEVTAIPEEELDFAPPYRRPRKIWGIGFNYRPQDEPLAPPAPGEEPVSFMKPDTTLIGPNDFILLPIQSERVTAEAELAIIIGRTCRNVSEAEAPDYVGGFAASLDMTAADIHAANPRYLTRSKSFDTFLGIGPEILTPDEVADVLDLEVTTAVNGEARHVNTVSRMRYSPWWIVAFHSRVMTLLPGDIILTGTPGPAVIRAGDAATCRIEGFEPLTNPVKDVRYIN